MTGLIAISINSIVTTEVQIGRLALLVVAVNVLTFVATTYSRAIFA